MPHFAGLKWYAGKSGRVFHETNQAGEERVYAVLPIVSGVVVMPWSVWPQEFPHAESWRNDRLSLCASDRDVAGQPYRRVLGAEPPAIKTYSQDLADKCPISRWNRTLPRTTLAVSFQPKIVKYGKCFRRHGGIYFTG